MTADNLWSPTSIAAAVTVTAITMTAVSYFGSSKPHPNQSALSQIPMPKGWYPYFGHLLSFGKLPGCKLKEWHDDLGPVIRVQMGVQQWIAINDPEILQHILTVNGAVASNRPNQLFSNRDYSNGQRGIVFQDANHRWRNLRAAAASLSLSPNVVNREITSIQDDAMKLVNALTTACQEHDAVDPLKFLHRASVSYALQTCIGMNVDVTEETLIQRIYEFTHESLALTGTHKDFGGFLPALSFLDKLPFRNTRQHIFMQKKDPLLRELFQRGLDAEKNNMVKHLYHEHKSLGLEEADLLVGLGDMIVGATDNVPAVIKWIIAILLHHLDLYKRLCDEVDAFLCNHDGRLPLFSERDSFPLLLSVLKESMRYRGTNYTTLPHVLTKDIYYKGYTFPQDVLILPSSYAMHRSPARYSDPETFIPERFLSDTKTLAADMTGNVEERYLYMFGWGRRACPGIYMAEVQLFTFLTCLLARCDLRLPINGALPDLDDARDEGVVTSPPPFKARFVLRKDCLLQWK